MSGQAHIHHRWLLGFLAACFGVLVLSPSGDAGGVNRVAQLRAEHDALAHRARSAALDLYSLDSRVNAAQSRLGTLQSRVARLHAERATLARELRLDHTDTTLSEARLASRLRFIYDHGTTSSLELFFGAKSLESALDQLDDMTHVASLNDDVLSQLQTARTHLTVTSARLSVEEQRLSTAESAAAATTVSLEQARDQRSGYVSQLEHQRDLTGAALAQAQVQALAAESLSTKLSGGTPAATVATVEQPTTEFTPTPGARLLTVSATAYSLPGRTSSGLPTGWGVAAVDPSVIPLGTHLDIPSYGEAIAADTGSAIIGDRIDVWFPTLAQADAWGRQLITIELH